MIGFLLGAVTGIPFLILLIKIIISYIKMVKKEERDREWRRIDEEREAREELRRNSMCYFTTINREEFETIAYECAKRIRRLSVEVKAPMVKGTVQSQSGISEWHFIVDFNDFGNITGSWWMLKCENSDSEIPKRYANLMMQEIAKKIK